MSKFKPQQKAYILDFMINSTRQDIDVDVIRYVRHAETKQMNVEIIVNGTYIVVPENRLLTEEEYWNGKTKD